MTFSDLRQKDVVNICDGRILGRPNDIVFDEQACVEAITVPAPTGFLSVLKGEKGSIIINWEAIRRIGDDVILVELDT